MSMHWLEYRMREAAMREWKNTELMTMAGHQSCHTQAHKGKKKSSFFFRGLLPA